MMAEDQAPELRETFLRQAAQNPGYAVAYALLEVAKAIEPAPSMLKASARSSLST